MTYMNLMMNIQVKIRERWSGTGPERGVLTEKRLKVLQEEVPLRYLGHFLFGEFSENQY